MKDAKYIGRDFYSVTWVMPQGWAWCSGPIFFQTWLCAYQIKGDDERNMIHAKVLPQGQTGDLGIGSKVKFH